jgi:outer membrane protein assembly factor BamB
VPLRRRAAQADRHTFELVDDGFAADAGPEAESGRDPGLDAERGGSDGPDHVQRAGRRRRRRLVAASAVVVVAVLGGMVTVDAAQSRADLARLREALGGVAPMASAPQEVWTLDVVPNGLELFQGAVVTAEGGDVTAYELATGQERWRTDVGESAYCGSTLLGYGYGAVATARDDLVCLVGGPDPLAPPAPPTDVAPTTPAVASAAAVLDADGGVVGRRELDAADGAAVPGPDGSLVRTLRVGEVPAEQGAELEVDPTTGEPTTVPQGRDVVVVLEDAVTGEERWRHELPFAVDYAWRCVSWTLDERSSTGASRALADLENMWAITVGDVVQVDGCGVSAWFGPDGTRLDDPQNSSDSVTPLADGALYRDPTGQGWWGYGGTPPEGAPAVLAADGSVRWEPPGPIVLPRSSDGRDLGLRLVRDDGVLTAYGDDGEARWSTPGAVVPDEVLTLAGGVVVASRDSQLVGLDARTGRELWTLESSALLDPTGDADDTRYLGYPTAFTDGEHVIVGVQDGSGRIQQLVAVDLTDGEVAWRTELGENAWPLAVQGALLVVGEGSVTRLG